MLINIKKTMTILSTLLLGIMCSFCSDTIDVYAGQFGEGEDASEPETPEVVGKIVDIDPLRNPDRGFHLECNLLADQMKSPYNDYEVYASDLYTKKVEQFDAKDDDLTLVQQYIYLTKWVSKDLDSTNAQIYFMLLPSCKGGFLKVIILKNKLFTCNRICHCLPSFVFQQVTDVTLTILLKINIQKLKRIL